MRVLVERALLFAAVEIIGRSRMLALVFRLFLVDRHLADRAYRHVQASLIQWFAQIASFVLVLNMFYTHERELQTAR